MPHLSNNSNCVHEQAASFTFDPFPSPGNGQVLTGGAKSYDIHRLNVRAVYFCYVPQMLHSGEVPLRYRYAVFVYLARPYRDNPVTGGGKREAAYTVKQAAEFHA
jgi:hypothetical protein